VSEGFLRPFGTSLSGQLDLLEDVTFFADLIGSLDELDTEVLDFEAAFLLVTLGGILKGIEFYFEEEGIWPHLYTNKPCRNAANVQASKIAHTNEFDDPILARIEFLSVIKQKY
jgi:hypothetical protein